MVITIVVDHPLDVPLSPAHLLFFLAFPFPFEPALHLKARAKVRGLAVNVPRSETGSFYAVARVGRVPTESCWYPASRIFFAALVSLSSSQPHVQLCHRSSRVFLTTAPHPEHTWLVPLGS